MRFVHSQDGSLVNINFKKKTTQHGVKDNDPRPREYNGIKGVSKSMMMGQSGQV